MTKPKNTSANYPPEVRDRAVRMVFDSAKDYPSQSAAIKSIAAKFGCGPSTLRNWVRRAEEARCAVIATAKKMSDTGLSPGRSGNISCRWEDGMLITPSGLLYDTLEPGDIAFVAKSGSASVKIPKPSSEWRFHLAVYSARSDCQAIVHAHSQNATVLACRHTPIPAFHYMVAIAGGRMIPCVPYAAFGTQELAAHVVSGLVETDACLMANHGQIAIGTSLDKALELAREVETLASQYVQVLSLGKPKLLNDAQMDDVLERFKGYGQNA